MKELVSLTVAAAAVTLLVVAFAAPVTTVAAAEAPDGKKVFLAQKCDLCHSVPTAGIEAKTKSEKMKGPDLVDSKREAAWIERYLKREIEQEGEKHKKEFKGSDEELKALIDWVRAQKRP